MQFNKLRRLKKIDIFIGYFFNSYTVQLINELITKKQMYKYIKNISHLFKLTFKANSFEKINN